MKFLVYRTTAKIYILAVVLIVSAYCSNSKSSIHKYKSITFSSTLPLYRSDNGKLIDWQNFVNIFYCGDYMLYAIPSYHDSSKVNVDKNGKYIGETLLKSRINYSYLIYHKGNNNGYLFDSITSKTPHKVNADSMARNITAADFPFTRGANDILLSIAFNSSSHILTEKHIYKEKKDSTYCDTLFFYYDKRLNDVPFSFSKKMDSIRKRKLFKVEFVTNSVVKHGVIIPTRIARFEIKRNSYDTIAIEKFVDRFKKEEENSVHHK